MMHGVLMPAYDEAHETCQLSVLLLLPAVLVMPARGLLRRAVLLAAYCGYVLRRVVAAASMCMCCLLYLYQEKNRNHCQFLLCLSL